MAVINILRQIAGHSNLLPGCRTSGQIMPFTDKGTGVVADTPFLEGNRPAIGHLLHIHQFSAQCILQTDHIMSRLRNIELHRIPRLVFCIVQQYIPALCQHFTGFVHDLQHYIFHPGLLLPAFHCIQDTRFLRQKKGAFSRCSCPFFGCCPCRGTAVCFRFFIMLY